MDGWTPDATPGTARRAAALILLYPGPLGPTIPLTLRHAGLPHHPGQISLPGGAQDPGESSAAAALREAEEEIGVPASHVRLLGPLSTLWIPVSNFVLTPFVAVSHATPLFRPHPAEVASVVDLPLEWLRDRGRIKWARRDRRGTPTDYAYFDVAGHRVWGATAMVLSEFVCLFEDEGTTTEGRGDLGT